MRQFFTWSLNLTLSDEPSRVAQAKGHSYSTTLTFVFNLKNWKNENAMDHIIRLLYYSTNKGLCPIITHFVRFVQDIPSGFDIMYLALADRNIQVRFGVKVLW